MVLKQPDPPKRKRAGSIKRAAAAVAAGVSIAAAGLPLQPADPLRELTTSTRAEAPDVLLGYQKRWIEDQAQLKIAEKGRRIGLTWAEAADDVLIASGQDGSNVFYISATQDMAREYIEACAMWARAYDFAAAEISEGIYDDGTDSAVDPAKRFIKTYEIVFPGSGKRIVALSSRPTNLRGKQGVIVIDEAAFAPDLKALLKAAMAMLLWGDKVRIISTHDGAENAFNELVQEVRAGKRGGPAQASVHRITFADAVQDGLYRRVCFRRGKVWTAEAEADWVRAAYAFYGDAAAEELDAVPSQSGGAYLSLALIETRSVAPNVAGGPALIRGKWDDAFAWLPEDVREAAVRVWCQEQLLPWLEALSPLLKHTFGMDFARNRNLSVISTLEEDGAAIRREKMVVELFNCPFSSQKQILWFILDHLKTKRWRGGAIDKGGNGAALAEETAQRYGTQMVEQVALNDAFYLAHMPKLKAGLEDGTLQDIPRDPQIRDDLRALKLVNGIAKLPKGDTNVSAAAKAAAADGGEKFKRHGDYAIALFLSNYAFFREVGEIGWIPAPAKADRWDAGGSDRRGRGDPLRDLDLDFGRKGGV